MIFRKAKTKVIEDNGIVKECKYKNYTIRNLTNLKDYEIGAITYIRHWDLTNVDIEILVKYDLCNLEYVYVGQTTEQNFRNRTRKFVYAVKNHLVEKDLYTFYENYKKLMLEVYGMNETDFDSYFFYDNDIDIYPMINKEESEVYENLFLNSYVNDYLNDKSCSYPLSIKDSDYLLNKDKTIKKYADDSKIMDNDLNLILGMYYFMQYSKNNNIEES